MNISSDDARRLQQIQSEMVELLNEFKDICRSAMTPNEYQQFRYTTLGHLEPSLMDETEWVTTYSSIKSLEKIALDADDDVNDADEGE